MARPPSPLTTFIRSLPVDLPVKDVIAQAKAAGHETSESNVSRVRGMMAASKTASKPKKVAKKAATPKKTSPSKNVTAPTRSAAPGTAKSAGVSKSEFIRLHPNLSAAEVIAAGKDQGLTFTSSLVYAVRGRQGGKDTPKKTAASKKPPTKKTATAPTKAPSSKDPAPSKSAFIRDLPLTTSAKEVVAQGKVAGLTFDDKYVHNIRRAAEKKRSSKEAASMKKASPKKTSTASKTTAPEKTSKTTAPKKATATTTSKADFVRERGHLSPKEIVEDAAGHGLKLDANYVYTVRGYDKRASKKKRAASKKGTAKKTATPVVTKTASTSKSAPTPTTSNGTRPSGSATSVEELLRAAAAELGLGRAIEILAGERARVRAVMGG